MAYTLKLNNNWDLCLDSNGNIATSLDDYAIAQNAANAVRLFLNDAFFARQKGVPHYQIELGDRPNPARSTLNNRIRQAVMQVEGVQNAQVTLDYNNNTRTFGGEITLTTDNGTAVRIEV